MRTSDLLKYGHKRVQTSGVYWPVIVWSLLGLMSWYFIGRGLLSPVGHRVPWNFQAIGPSGWYVLAGEMFNAARQSGWLTLASSILVIRLALSPAVDALIYHRLTGRRGKPAWRGFYCLNVVLLLGMGLLGWILYVHVDTLINLVYQPVLTLGWVLISVIGMFVSGLLLSWYKLRLSDRAQVFWPRLGLWFRVATLQMLLSILFGLLIGIIQYASLSAAGLLLVAMLILTTLVRTYGKLWKMACAILALQGR